MSSIRTQSGTGTANNSPRKVNPVAWNNSSMEQKIKDITAILSQPEIDLWALRELCLTDGGLVNDEIRKKAWPKLVGIVHAKQTPSTAADSKPQLSTIVPPSLSVISPESVTSFKNTIMASCIDAVQISLDTARCTWHLLNGTQRANRNTMRNKHKKRVRTLLKRKQRRLGNFINLTLIRTYNEHTKLRYYQGYHDVSCIILSVLGGETTVPPSDMEKNPKSIQAMATKTAQAMGLDLPSEVLAKLSHSHFVDLMKDNFEHLTKALRLIVFPLMACLDPEVHQHFVECDMEPFFCLSWIITWFSHDVRDTAVVKRLFDFFIASHPIMPIYMSIAMVLHPMNRMEVLGTGCDFASLHRTLSQLPMNSCSVGWKFIGSPAGGEYVSGEEDDDSCSLDGSIMSQDVYREEGGDCGDDDSLAPSLTSESMLSGCDSSRVPFQEVIDMAINFMRRIPPRKLIRLAHRYYDGETIQHLAGNADNISMLQQPPEWATASSILSDYAAKNIAHSQEYSNGNKSTRKEELSKDIKYLQAVIAAGIGPDGDGDAIKRKRRRKMLRTSAIVVGMISIFLGMVERQVIVIPFNFTMTRANANSIGSSFSRRSDLNAGQNYGGSFSEMKSSTSSQSSIDGDTFDNSTDTDEYDSSVSMNVIESSDDKTFDNIDKIGKEDLEFSTSSEATDLITENFGATIRDEEEQQVPVAANSPTCETTAHTNGLTFEVISSFVQKQKENVIEIGKGFYKEAKEAIDQVDPLAVKQYIYNEVKCMAKITREALAEEADIVLL